MQKILFSYLRFWAKGYLARTKPEIIAITGSVGKTSTKEAVFSVLREKFGRDVRKSEGNLNNESGVPVAILGFKHAPSYEAKNPLGWILIMLAAPFKSFFLKKVKILVLEYAADKPGDIKYLTDLAKPKIAVLTSIGPSHLENFNSLTNIIEEKADLLRALNIDKESWAILNLDDDNVKKIAYAGRFQKKTYGIDTNADFRATDITTEISGFKALSKFKISFENKKILIRQNILGGVGNINAALAAAAIGRIYDLTDTEIKAGLEKVKSEKHRLNIVKGKNGSIIIDDAYNASPSSVKAALNILNKLSCQPGSLAGGKKIVVLGDMRELGKVSTESHKDIGQYAKEHSDDQVAIGNLAKNYNFKNYFKNPSKAEDYLLNNISEGDIILIKASRAIGLEKLVESLKE